MSQPFAAWLLDQGGRKDWIGVLARAAARDPKFPLAGGPHEVRARVHGAVGEGDLYAAVDAAVYEWHGGPGGFA